MSIISCKVQTADQNLMRYKKKIILLMNYVLLTYGSLSGYPYKEVFIEMN